MSSLRKFLEGLEECCREEMKGSLAKVWEEDGRKFKVERRENGAGKYISVMLLMWSLRGSV